MKFAKLMSPVYRLNPIAVTLWVYVFLQFSLFVVAFISINYLELDFYQKFFFLRADGWCSPVVPGIGVHCFGDYSLTTQIASAPNPWSNPLLGTFNYPPLSVLPFKFFSILDSLSSNLGLALYLGSAAFSVAIAAYLATRHLGKTTRLITIFFSFLSVPVVFAIDRGNSVVFLVLFLYLFLTKVLKNDFRYLGSVIFVLASLKPQFIILILVLVVLKKNATALKVVASFVACNLAALAFWPSAIPNSLSDAIEGVLGFSGMYDFNAAYPSNSSIIRGFDLLFGNLIETKFFLLGYQGTSILLMSVVIVFLILGFRNLPTYFLGVALIVFASLGLTISWPYYLVFGTAIILWMIGNEKELLSISGGSMKWILVIIGIMSSFSASRFMFISDNEVFSTTEIVGFGWLVALLIAAILATFAKPRGLTLKR
jgi:hypothetical protein